MTKDAAVSYVICGVAQQWINQTKRIFQKKWKARMTPIDDKGVQQWQKKFKEFR